MANPLCSLVSFKQLVAWSLIWIPPYEIQPVVILLKTIWKNNRQSVVGPFAPASLTESFNPTKALTPHVSESSGQWHITQASTWELTKTDAFSLEFCRLFNEMVFSGIFFVELGLFLIEFRVAVDRIWISRTYWWSFSCFPWPKNILNPPETPTSTNFYNSRIHELHYIYRYLGMRVVSPTVQSSVFRMTIQLGQRIPSQTFISHCYWEGEHPKVKIVITHFKFLEENTSWLSLVKCGITEKLDTFFATIWRCWCWLWRNISDHRFLATKHGKELTINHHQRQIHVSKSRSLKPPEI